MDILSVLILILSLPGVVFSLLACSERDSEREREREWWPVKTFRLRGV